ncbi:hypothetical protein [Rhodanobacter caeni]|uniref:Uncharacterized protein n=1 Tax=Rhodanobacter caeni TaxID=657654 RepID=A0ABP3DVY5_9GAMM
MDTKKVTGVAGAAAAASAAAMFIPGGFIVGPVVAAITSALAASQRELEDAEGKPIESLRETAARQQIVMDLQAHHARVAQEMSIAQRISSSREVEIEEYYDFSGKGSAGVKTQEKDIALGLSGEGRKVTKRVIKFKGWESDKEVDVSELG